MVGNLKPHNFQTLHLHFPFLLSLVFSTSGLLLLQRGQLNIVSILIKKHYILCFFVEIIEIWHIIHVKNVDVVAPAFLHTCFDNPKP